MSSVADERQDFSNDKTVETEEKLWTISRAEVEDTDEGDGTYLSVDFQDEDTPFPRNERFWLKHDNVPGKKIDQMVKIARANAKRLYKAVLGVTAGEPSLLVGHKVTATISEDDRGYAHIGKFKPAPEQEGVS